MEISSNDIDIDNLLLQQFRCMGTQDKEALVNQFENLFGTTKPSREICGFYLEMNNWNLAAAIGSYFEYQQETNSAYFPPLSYLPKVNVEFRSPYRETGIDQYNGESEVALVQILPPKTKFQLTWKFTNIGETSWSPGCSLKLTDGTLMCSQERFTLDCLPPGSSCTVSLCMTSPEREDEYYCVWQLSTLTGSLFGDEIKIRIRVTNDPSIISYYPISTDMADENNSPATEFDQQVDDGDQLPMMLAAVSTNNNANFDRMKTIDNATPLNQNNSSSDNSSISTDPYDQMEMS